MANCCGGPAPKETDACCVKDADAKAAGESGCGCGCSTSREEKIGPPVTSVKAKMIEGVTPSGSRA